MHIVGSATYSARDMNEGLGTGGFLPPVMRKAFCCAPRLDDEVSRDSCTPLFVSGCMVSDLELLL